MCTYSTWRHEKFFCCKLCISVFKKSKLFLPLLRNTVWYIWLPYWCMWSCVPVQAVRMNIYCTYCTYCTYYDINMVKSLVHNKANPDVTGKRMSPSRTVSQKSIRGRISLTDGQETGSWPLPPSTKWHYKKHLVHYTKITICLSFQDLLIFSFIDSV